MSSKTLRIPWRSSNQRTSVVRARLNVWFEVYPDQSFFTRLWFLFFLFFPVPFCLVHWIAVALFWIFLELSCYSGMKTGTVSCRKRCCLDKKLFFHDNLCFSSQGPKSPVEQTAHTTCRLLSCASACPICSSKQEVGHVSPVSLVVTSGNFVSWHFTNLTMCNHGFFLRWLNIVSLFVEIHHRRLAVSLGSCTGIVDGEPTCPVSLVSALTPSLPRVINVKFLLQPHQ